MRLRLSVFRARSSHSWSRKDRSTGAALSSLREARVVESDGTMSGERSKNAETGRGGEGEANERKKIVNVCRLFLQHHASPSEFPAPGSSRPRVPLPLLSSPPPSSSRSPRVLWFLTFRATFITHRLPPVDSSWWLRRVPCCRRSRRLGTAFGSHSWARPSARPWRVADVCTRRPCYSPRTRATACYRTRCAHSCQRRRKAGGPDAVRDCCDTPAGIRRE